jgi:hypothetical protein
MKRLLSIVSLGLVLWTSSCALVLPKETVCSRVTEKERIITADSSKYLIFTEAEVFENTDDFSVLKTNSSDFYARIEKGKTYCFSVVGFRVSFLSWYRNIISFTEVE